MTASQEPAAGQKGGAAVRLASPNAHSRCASPIMTVPEACEYLRTSRAGLYRMTDTEAVAKPVRRGGRAFFRHAHIAGVAAKLEALAMDSELGL